MPIASNKKPARAYPSVNAVHCIRSQIQQSNPIPVSGQYALKTGKAVHIGTIPAGSFVLAPSKHTVVAFDGTTPTIVVGSETDDDAFIVAAGALQTLGFAGALTGGVGLGFVAEETPVYIKLLGGAGNTQGQVDVVLPFYPAKD